MSFANWDEIIDTCVSYSTKNLPSLPCSSPFAKRTPRQFTRAVQSMNATEFKRLDGPDLEDPWTNKSYNEMLAREYVYTVSEN